MLETCDKYGLLDMVYGSIYNGSYITMHQWKNLIKRIVNQKQISALQRSCRMYTSLSHMMPSTLNGKQLSWWLYVQRSPWDAAKCSIIVRLLLNTYRLGSNMCKLCNQTRDTLAHILFTCTVTDELRATLWSPVIVACPPQLVEQMSLMSDNSRTMFIVNALNCDYIGDWHLVYESVMHYIYAMFSNYYSA